MKGNLNRKEKFRRQDGRDKKKILKDRKDLPKKNKKIFLMA